MRCPSALRSWHTWISHTYAWIILASRIHWACTCALELLHPLYQDWIFFLLLQNSGVIKLHGSEKESWLDNISENPHSYCNHFILPKGNPSNGNFHSWHPFLTSLRFLLQWLTSNDLMCRRWEYLETTLETTGQLCENKFQISIFRPKNNVV